MQFSLSRDYYHCNLCLKISMVDAVGPVCSVSNSQMATSPSDICGRFSFYFFMSDLSRLWCLVTVIMLTVMLCQIIQRYVVDYLNLLNNNNNHNDNDNNNAIANSSVDSVDSVDVISANIVCECWWWRADENWCPFTQEAVDSWRKGMV